MALANSTIKMEECMTGCGRKIKCMALAPSTINLENWHTKECGSRINFRARVNFLTNILTCYKTNSIITILIKLTNTGHITKVKDV